MENVEVLRGLEAVLAEDFWDEVVAGGDDPFAPLAQLPGAVPLVSDGSLAALSATLAAAKTEGIPGQRDAAAQPSVWSETAVDLPAMDPPEAGCIHIGEEDVVESAVKTELQDVSRNIRHQFQIRGNATNEHNFGDHLALWLVETGVLEQVHDKLRESLPEHRAMPIDVTVYFVYLLLKREAQDLPESAFFGRQARHYEPERIGEWKFDAAQFRRLFDVVASTTLAPADVYLGAGETNSAETGRFPVMLEDSSSEVQTCAEKFAKFACEMCFSRTAIVALDREKLLPNGTQPFDSCLSARSTTTGIILSQEYFESSAVNANYLLQVLGPLSLHQNVPLDSFSTGPHILLDSSMNPLQVAQDPAMRNLNIVTTSVKPVDVAKGRRWNANWSRLSSSDQELFQLDYANGTGRVLTFRFSDTRFAPDQWSALAYPRYPNRHVHELQLSYSSSSLSKGNVALDSLNNMHASHNTGSGMTSSGDNMMDSGGHTLHSSSPMPYAWPALANKLFVELTSGQRDVWGNFFHSIGRINNATLAPLLATFAFHTACLDAEEDTSTDKPGNNALERERLPDAVRTASLNVLSLTGNMATLTETMHNTSSLEEWPLEQLQQLAKTLGVPISLNMSSEELISVCQTIMSGNLMQASLMSSILRPISRQPTRTKLTIDKALDSLRGELVRCKVASEVFGQKRFGLVRTAEFSAHCTMLESVLAFRPINRDDPLAPPVAVDSPEQNGQGQLVQKVSDCALRHASRSMEWIQDQQVQDPSNSVCFAAVDIVLRQSQASLIDEPYQHDDTQSVPAIHKVVLDSTSLSYAQELATFYELIPRRSERCSLFQHTASGLHDVLHVVVASAAANGLQSHAGRILKIVHVRFAPRLVQDLALVVGYVGDRYLEWVLNPAQPAPPSEQLDFLRSSWGLSPSDIQTRRWQCTQVQEHPSLHLDHHSPESPLRIVHNIVPRIVDWCALACWYQSHVFSDSVRSGIHKHAGSKSWLLHLLFSSSNNAANTYLVMSAAASQHDWHTAEAWLMHRRERGSLAHLVDSKLEWSSFREAVRRLLPRELTDYTPDISIPASTTSSQQILHHVQHQQHIHQQQQQHQQSQQQQGMLSNHGAASIDSERGLHSVLRFQGEVWDPEHNSAQAEMLRASTEALIGKSHSVRMRLLAEDELLIFLRRSHNMGVRHTASNIEMDIYGQDLEKSVRRDGIPCYLCCSECEKKSKPGHTSRRAYHTKTWCVDCGLIPLCTTGRAMWNNRTCFEIWHDINVDERRNGNLDLCPCQNQANKHGDPFDDQGETTESSTARLFPRHLITDTTTFLQRSSRKRRRTTGVVPLPTTTESSMAP